MCRYPELPNGTEGNDDGDCLYEITNSIEASEVLETYIGDSSDDEVDSDEEDSDEEDEEDEDDAELSEVMAAGAALLLDISAVTRGSLFVCGRGRPP